ncbi:MAG TPA: hypothetical protein VGO49_03265 [Bradyrhizobium sp.]|nr:hypothetical protein [Bradyrhizobium sp.]
MSKKIARIQLVTRDLSPKPASDLLGRNLSDETIETIDDITRKKSAAKPIITETPTGHRTMLKPSFRFFIIPLGAICTLASLSSQNAAPRAQRDIGSMLVRQQATDCSNKNPSEVCVISTDGEATGR